MDLDLICKLVITCLILIVLLILTFIVKIVLDKQFQNSVSQSKLALTSGIVKGENDTCYILISNRSFSNVIISSLGFRGKLKERDYTLEYKQNNNILDTQKIVIPARESIKFEIDFKELYQEFEGNKIEKIKCYTIDSLGFRRTKYSKEIRKQIAIIAKPIYKEKKALEKVNNK